jgi:hypothetical protein
VTQFKAGSTDKHSDRNYGLTKKPETREEVDNKNIKRKKDVN